MATASEGIESPEQIFDIYYTFSKMQVMPCYLLTCLPVPYMYNPVVNSIQSGNMTHVQVSDFYCKGLIIFL